MFLAKKVIGALLMPLPLSLIMLGLAAILYWRSRYRTAKILAGVTLGLLYLLSLPWVAKAISEPLEFMYSKYDGSPVDYVIVLGGYHRSDERIPLSSLLSQTSLMRLTEGIAIWRQNPQASLLLSGYGGNDVISNARAMASIALASGVPAEAIVLAEAPRDTASEARHWASIVRGQEFALVTSAMHLPRAMFLFKAQNLNPVPSPTAYKSAGRLSSLWSAITPSSRSLVMVEQAWHEYLGLVWAGLRT